MASITDNKNLEVLDLGQIVKKLLARKKLFVKTIPTTFVLSCIIILCVPRYYTSETMLAPELDNSLGGSSLGSLASSMGLDLFDGQTSDAISPLLYPDLMEDNAFVADLFTVNVEDKDKEIKTTYFNYLKDYQKTAWWNIPLAWIKKLLSTEPTDANGKGAFDPYRMSKLENDIADAIRGNIRISVDKKTGVITISVKAQDPVICKTLADSMQTKLQQFITTYRTNKARIDLNYYTTLTEEAKSDYEKARRLYARYSDANMDATLMNVRAELTDLENDMQLKYNTYSTLCTQLQGAKAKVQERTPAFTVVKGASVPTKPAGPKRMLFVLGMTFLAFICTSLFISFHYND